MDNEYVIALKDQTAWLSIQEESETPPEVLNSQLLVLQTAFPTVVRNYDQYEFQALQSLWQEIFKHVPEQLMKEAVKRFIVNDRKGFFPSPGQIIGCIEEIVEEQKEAARIEDWIKLQRELDRYFELVRAGENCTNCDYCRQGKESIYCSNEKSENFVGKRKAGVTKDFRCEYFKSALKATS